MVPKAVEQQLPATANNYFIASAFSLNAHGRIEAKKGNSQAVHALMFDDLGTKVRLEKLGWFELSWLIETSPGNYQGGVIFAEPITAKQADDLNERVIAAGLCDTGATSPATRWCRLPAAINGKPKYTQPDGSAFQCRLAKWSPEKRYSPQEIIAGLNLSASSAPAGKSRHLSRIGAGAAAIKHDGDDPVVAALKTAGLYKRALRNGAHDITCPWVDEHTDHIDDGAAYFPPSAANTYGGFKCHHAHGAELNITKLKAFLQLPAEEAEKFDALVAENKREAQKLEKAAIRALINDTEKDDAVAAFVRVMVSDGADSIISKSDESLLIAEVAKKSGAEKRAIKAELAEARQKRNSSRKSAEPHPKASAEQDNESGAGDRDTLLVVQQNGVPKRLLTPGELDRDYAILIANGSASVYISRSDFQPIQENDLKRRLEDAVVQTGTHNDHPTYTAALKYFTGNAHRHVYRRAAFTNKELPPDVMNLYRGLGVTPYPGVCDKILNHIFEVICASD